MRERCRRRAASASLMVALGGAFAVPSVLRAQDDLGGMISECNGPLPSGVEGLCTDGALVLAATRAGVGLGMTHGSPVPGSASTLGRRMASSPRLAFSLRGGVARAPYADPGNAAGAPSERRFWARSLEGGITIGLLEGWSLMPTVGGFLSLDLLASVGLIGLSSDAGFAGSVEQIGYGARIGVFRESFTLPGVSVAVARRHASEVEWGRGSGDGVHATFRPVATSVRVTAAKDLLAIGVLAGLGWDRYGGESAFTAQRTLGPLIQSPDASSDDVQTDRQLVFLGLSYTLLVFQLSAEGGWARGWSGPDGTGGWDPSSSSLFGSIAARLTY